MSLQFLPEYVDEAKIALALAKLESNHLRYTATTLFAMNIDTEWVRRLNERQDFSEKIDAFVIRFGRLQDHIGEKLLPAFSRLLVALPKSLLDVRSYAERMCWVGSAEEFIGARKLRNLLVHEYMSEVQLFFDALISAQTATSLLFSIVDNLQQEAQRIGLPQ